MGDFKGVDLPQSVFDGAPDWVTSAEIINFELYWFSDDMTRSQLVRNSPLLAPLCPPATWAPTMRQPVTPRAPDSHPAAVGYQFPAASVTTVTQVSVELSAHDVGELLRAAIVRQYPELGDDWELPAAWLPAGSLRAERVK